MNSHAMIVDLVSRGPKVRSKRKGRWVHTDECNRHEDGGYIMKVHDVFVKRHQRSKFREGSGWWKGFQ